MDHKTLGWIQIIGGALALLSAGRVGYSGMMGMMGFYGGYNMMTMGSGLGVTILAVLFIISGIHFVTKKTQMKIPIAPRGGVSISWDFQCCKYPTACGDWVGKIG